MKIICDNCNFSNWVACQEGRQPPYSNDVFEVDRKEGGIYTCPECSWQTDANVTNLLYSEGFGIDTKRALMAFGGSCADMVDAGIKFCALESQKIPHRLR